MATTIRAMGDTIKIDKTFASGKDRIAVNGQVVFEGKVPPDAPRQKVSVGAREYDIELTKVSKLTNASVVQLQIFENNELVHSGVYDQFGKPAEDAAKAKQQVAVQVCAGVGALIGFATMMALNAATCVVPGGAIGGGIGGGVGAVIGSGVGSAVFGRK